MSAGKCGEQDRHAVSGAAAQVVDEWVRGGDVRGDEGEEVVYGAGALGCEFEVLGC